MRSIKVNYFLGYALLGAVQPYLPVYLRAQDLTNTQVGYILGMMGVAILLSPVALTLLADVHLEGKTLLAWVFAVSTLSLAGLLVVDGFWPIFVVHTIYCLAFVAMIPLQDGLTFQTQAQRQSVGRPIVPYHRVRVWGTVGFIVPSLILYLALAAGAPIGAILVVGAAVGVAGLINAITLPRTRSVPRGDADEPAVPPTGPEQSTTESNTNRPSRLPTGDALHAMLRPHVLVFCGVIFLAHIASSAYYAFYPLYLTEQIGVGSQWVGLIANLGVAIEVFFMLGFGFLMARLGVRWLLTLGMAAMAMRMLLLYAAPSIGVAVGTQVFHGLHVLVIHVIPPIFLNHQAETRYRNSIHGLYAMTVYGVGRLLGAVLAGVIADEALLAVFGYSGVLCGAAAILFALLYREPAAAGASGKSPVES